eukprot:5622138-Prymnesium_polylepis.1
MGGGPMVRPVAAAGSACYPTVSNSVSMAPLDSTAMALAPIVAGGAHGCYGMPPGTEPIARPAAALHSFAKAPQR